MWESDIHIKSEPMGYKKLIEFFNLKAIPHYCWSFTSPKWEKRELHFKDQNLTIYIYPPSYRLSENIFDQLEFALKYEGINLYIIKKVLSQISESELIAYIKKQPGSKFARVLWYLYEKFNNKNLPLPDLDQGTYVPLLNPKLYYYAQPIRSSRHRIADNLLGNIHFSPIVRKTSSLQKYEKRHLFQEVEKLAKKYEPSLLARAMRYLYTKETMSSWEIEREKPDNVKLGKFVGLLHKAHAIGPLSEETFVKLQKNIVDSRFASNSYRKFQNYVGEEPELNQLILHYISPRPEDVGDLMVHLISSFDRIEKSEINPVIAAATLAFSFVYIHPFEDGNGRIHRFLIHYALSRLKFTPEGIVFPISAVIAREKEYYDKTLEAFSKPLLGLITEYQLNDIGEMKVLEDTRDYYCYIDFTPMTEYLYECVDKTITTDFQKELTFLAEYDEIKRLFKTIIDMPDQKIDLFIRCVRQNGGKLSSKKRENYFNMLTDKEIKEMEGIIREVGSLNLSSLKVRDSCFNAPSNEGSSAGF